MNENVFNVAEPFENFPTVLSAIRQGTDRNLHTGVQIYVSKRSVPLLNAGFGQASADREFDSDTISLWRSAGKPVTAVAILRLVQQARFRLDSPLKELLPEVVGSVVAGITVEQLLTHTSGIPIIETGWPQVSWQQILSTICSVSELSVASAYQPQSTWFLLGEILRRFHKDDVTYQEALAQGVLEPLGMNNTWCGLSENAVAEDSHRLPDYWTREKGQLSESSFSRKPWLTAPSPGGNLRGPVSSLGRFYEMLLNDGQLPDGEAYLSPSMVTEMIARRRVGKFDETLQHIVDFGLGLIVDSNQHGIETVPYGFGRHCSAAAFGHGGSQCAMGFCDPEHHLVVCWAANGFCGEGQHQRRNRAINEAVYVDLGLL